VATVRETIENRLDKIDAEIEELREQIDDCDFDSMAKQADKIGEQADSLANKLAQISASLSEDDEDGETELEEEDDSDEEEEEKPAKRSKKK
jgi:uncharacterized membrane-anchored protein YhcB (DUF1043 family)